MLKPDGEWMRPIWAMILVFCVSGCANVVSETAICDGTKESRSAHAAALAEDGGDASVVTGARLISQIDAACGIVASKR